MEQLKKNSIIPLKITGMTAEGNGVGKHEGMAVFVPLTAVGDELEVKLVKLCKSYCYGIIERIIIPSPDRIEPDCGVFRQCGGCCFRHISYSAELKIKDGFVRDAFERIGGFKELPSEPPLGAEEADGYRNKAQYPVADLGSGLVSGFYAGRSHRLIPQTDCRLQPAVFAEITSRATQLAQEAGISAYDEKADAGELRHIYLRQGYSSGEIMLCFVVRRAVLSRLQPVAAVLAAEFPQIKSVIMNINGERTNVILGKRCVTLLGSDTISDRMCGITAELSPQSFYQVNTRQAERLYKKAGEYAAPQPTDTLLDLYCGAGIIGLSMADGVKRLIGGEIVPQAVENARRNALANGIGNAEFILGDAGELASRLAESERPDIIVLDPPRKGCDTATLSAVLKMSPAKVVMISCNPATAARDARILADGGYTLTRLCAVDMFPRTGHVETVVLLSKL